MAAFYLNRTNRSGILTGDPIGGSTRKSKYRLDAQFDRESLAAHCKDRGEKKPGQRPQ